MQENFRDQFSFERCEWLTKIMWKRNEGQSTGIFPLSMSYNFSESTSDNSSLCNTTRTFVVNLRVFTYLPPEFGWLQASVSKLLDSGITTDWVPPMLVCTLMRNDYFEILLYFRDCRSFVVLWFSFKFSLNKWHYESFEIDSRPRLYQWVYCCHGNVTFYLIQLHYRRMIAFRSFHPSLSFVFICITKVTYESTNTYFFSNS